MLSGCADNTIRIDRAQAVATSGKAATTAANGFLTRVVNARNDANIAIVASDTSCAWGETVILRGTDRPAPKPPERPSLCLPRGVSADPKYDDLTVDLRSLQDSALRPTMSLIGALTSYLGAVNAIVGGTAPDVSGQLADAYGKATAVQKYVNAIADTKISIVPELTKDQQSAIGDLIKLITTLADEQSKADKLRDVALSQNPAVIELIGKLKAQIDLWAQDSLTGDLQMVDGVYLRLGRQLGDQPPRFKDFEVRRTLLTHIVAARTSLTAAPAFVETVDTALDDLIKAQNKFWDAFGSPPHWTDAEREKAAKENVDRILSALQSIASIAAAFAL